MVCACVVGLKATSGRPGGGYGGLKGTRLDAAGDALPGTTSKETTEQAHVEDAAGSATTGQPLDGWMLRPVVGLPVAAEGQAGLDCPLWSFALGGPMTPHQAVSRRETM